MLVRGVGDLSGGLYIPVCQRGERRRARELIEMDKLEYKSPDRAQSIAFGKRGNGM